jgi:phosphoglycerol transferase MdoB-like AlkP superfamily enzyme
MRSVCPVPLFSSGFPARRDYARIMPCLLVLVVLFFPRLILILMWLFSNTLDRAYHGLVIPLLGFIFLPITTIVYAWMVTSGLPIEGFNLVLLIVAVLLDAGSHGGGVRYSRRRWE